ncbi:hypothetical protein ES707_09190 [subsurface metagenome]
MATEILRPNAAGDVTELSKSGGTYNWEMVDEASTDQDTTYVYYTKTHMGHDYYDLYNLPAHSGSGTINFVKVYVRCRISEAEATQRAYIKIKTGGTVYTGSAISLSASYTTAFKQYDINPKVGGAWTWEQVDALQIGVRLYAFGTRDYYTSAERCTQVYVEVDYTDIVAPTVTTQAVDDIDTTTATSNQTITDTGGENCSKRGACWNTGGNPTISDSKSEETNSFGTGAFERPMTGLTPGQHYYVKGYAYNSEGYGYGSQVEFTTKAIITGSASGSGIGLASSSAKLDVLAQALGNGIGLSLASSYLIVPATASGAGIGLGAGSAYLIIPASASGNGIGLGVAIAKLIVLSEASGSGLGIGSTTGVIVKLGTAAGEGIGLGQATGEVVVVAVVGTGAGSGIGTATAQGILDVIAQAQGSGVGEATVQAILDILAEAGGSGIGLGSTEALIRVLAAAAASGEGLGAAEALLEVVAEATGEGIGSGQGQSYIIVFGNGQCSGVGVGITQALLDIIAFALGSGIGSGLASAAFEIFIFSTDSGVGIEATISRILASIESGSAEERASRAGWLMKPVVYTKDAFEQKVYTGE